MLDPTTRRYLDFNLGVKFGDEEASTCKYVDGLPVYRDKYPTEWIDRNPPTILTKVS